MSDWPLVTICIITYNRLREIKATISALRTHFHYEGPVAWHIADDGSPRGYLGYIISEFPDITFTHTNTQRKGWGCNANAALHFLRDKPYVFFIEDDYVAKLDLDITTGIALMESNKDIALVRYDGVAAHTFTLHLLEADTRIGKFSYCTIDHASPHLNVYSNRPHLKSRRFHEKYGRYPERKSLGMTETEFAHHVKDNPSYPKIAILADGIPTAFDHIGVSRQGTEHDMETLHK